MIKLQKLIAAVLLSFCFLLSGCGSPAQMLDNLQNGPPPVTGLVVRQSDTPLIGQEVFTAHSAVSAVKISVAADAQEESALLSAFAADETITALGCQLSQDSDAAALVEIARRYEKPVVFWGENPSDTILDSYDRCWYVGSREQEAGELMGQIVCNAFENNTIADQNQNKLVDYVLIGDKDSIKGQSTLEVLENAGYFSDPVRLILANAAEEEEADSESSAPAADGAQNPQTPYELAGALLDNSCYVELFICPSAHDAADVVRAIEARSSIATPEEDFAAAEEALADTEEDEDVFLPSRLQYGIICGEETPQSSSMLKRGVILGYAAYDADAAAETILTLAANAGRRVSPSENLSYTIEAHRRIYIPHVAHELPPAD